MRYRGIERERAREKDVATTEKKRKFELNNADLYGRKSSRLRTLEKVRKTTSTHTNRG